MKKSIIGKMITVFTVIMITIELGIMLGYYILLNTDFNKYKTNYNMVVAK